jgi:hypothetical protein
MSVDRSSVMVSFLIPEENGGGTERMHATPLGEGRYIIDNSPFYVFNISCGDVIQASTDKDGEKSFLRVESRGGHSTYRIRLPIGLDHKFFLENWAALGELGCTYEGSSVNSGRLYSVDIGPDVNVFDVYKILDEKERQGVWVFEEAHYFSTADNKSG